MSSTKTYSCKYCDIQDLTRKDFIKHTKTTKHKNKLSYSRNCAKVRTQVVVNQKCSSTQVKFTKDGKLINDYIKNMMKEDEEQKKE